MKLMTLKQYMKMSKPALIRKITKTLRMMPKKRLAVLCYNITKAKLPTLRTTKRKALSNPYGLTAQERGFYLSKKGKVVLTSAGKPFKRRKKKRKFSAKQLAAQRLFAKRARAGTLKRRRR